MKNDLSNYRKSYEKYELLESNIPDDPINLFKKWFHEMEDFDENGEINAMTVSTYGLDHFPNSRVVLLKKFDENGFVFYTNYLSDKGFAIEKNPHVCLSFFWQTMERQVIIKGIAKKTSKNNSDGYFDLRPRGSQLGAYISQQSKVVPSRNFLEQQLKIAEKNFEGKEIPRPEHWGGYIVNPSKIEFWQGRPNRIHDRIRYTLQPDFNWLIERLSP